jgi:hypothetical protein
MAEQYGTVEEFSMEEILRISEDFYFHEMENQKILDDEL